MTEPPRSFNMTDNKSACVKHCKKVLTHIGQTGNIIRNDRSSVVHPSPPAAKSFRKYKEPRVVQDIYYDRSFGTAFSCPVTFQPDLRCSNRKVAKLF
jgi:hypothetical protein